MPTLLGGMLECSNNRRGVNIYPQGDNFLLFF